MGVYRKIAKEALKKFYGFSEEDAKDTAESKEVEWLERGYDEGKGFYGVGAQNSITAGVSSLVESLESEENPEEIVKEMLRGDDSKIRDLGALKTDSVDTNSLIVDALRKIHDKWCIDNAKKFHQANRNRQFQHLPIELIGWEEANKDLLFLDPILAEMGIEYNMNELEKEYDKTQLKFMEEHGIKDEQSMAEYIRKGEYSRELADSLDDENPKKELLNNISTSFEDNGRIEGEEGPGVVEKTIKQLEDKKCIAQYPETPALRLSDIRDRSRELNK